MENTIILENDVNNKCMKKRVKICANCVYYDIYEEACTFWVRFFGYGTKKYPTETCIFMG